MQSLSIHFPLHSPIRGAASKIALNWGRSSCAFGDLSMTCSKMALGSPWFVLMVFRPLSYGDGLSKLYKYIIGWCLFRVLKLRTQISSSRLCLKCITHHFLAQELKNKTLHKEHSANMRSNSQQILSYSTHSHSCWLNLHDAAECYFPNIGVLLVPTSIFHEKRGLVKGWYWPDPHFSKWTTGNVMMARRTFTQAAQIVSGLGQQRKSHGRQLEP